jgi:hypothetical protein
MRAATTPITAPKSSRASSPARLRTAFNRISEEGDPFVWPGEFRDDGLVKTGDERTNAIKKNQGNECAHAHIALRQ